MEGPSQGNDEEVTTVKVWKGSHVARMAGPLSKEGWRSRRKETVATEG